MRPVAARRHHGAIEWLSGRWSAATPARPVESSYRFLEAHRAAFGIVSPREEFSRLAVVHPDLLAGWHDVYLQQRVHGVPVLQGRLAFHYDAGGRLVAVNGEYVPSTDAIQAPALSADEAATRALAATAALPAADELADLSAGISRAPMVLGRPPSARLVYFLSYGSLRLAYEIVSSAPTPPRRGRWSSTRAPAPCSLASATSRRWATASTCAARRWRCRRRRSAASGSSSTAASTCTGTTTNHPYTKFEGCIEIRDYSSSAGRRRPAPPVRPAGSRPPGRGTAWPCRGSTG